MHGNHFISMYGSQIEGSFEAKLAKHPNKFDLNQA